MQNVRRRFALPGEGKKTVVLLVKWDGQLFWNSQLYNSNCWPYEGEMVVAVLSPLSGHDYYQGNIREGRWANHKI